VQVTDPSGRTWRVERRLIELPHWRTVERPSFDLARFAFSGENPVAGLLIGSAVAILMVLSFVFVFPLLILIAELVLAGLLLVAHFVFGRWTVIASTYGERKSWRVRGRRESQRLATQVADALRSGSVLPPEVA
jgi:hypothetical protein